MESLNKFVASLSLELQVSVAGRKPLGIINGLLKQGVVIPQDIIDEYEERRKCNSSHDDIMASMRPFMGNKVSDFPTMISDLNK